MTRGGAPSRAFSSRPPGPTRPPPGPAATPGRAWAQSSVSSGATPCPRATVAHGGRMVRRLVASARAPKHPRAPAWARLGPRRATRPAKGPLLQPPRRCRRGHEAGHQDRARGENQPEQGQARRLLAHQLARTGSCLRKRTPALALEPWLCPSGSRAREPGASLDTHGRRRPRADGTPSRAASGHAAGHRGPLALSPALCWATRSGACRGGGCPHQARVGCPSPAPDPHWRVQHTQPDFCRGRYEGRT